MGSNVIDGAVVTGGAAVDGIIDTDRYPLDDPGAPAWDAVVEQARRDLRAEGATVLRDVVRPELRDRLRAEGDAVAPHAHTATAQVNVYNTDPNPTLPPEHPSRVALTRRNAFVARDHIPADHLIQTLYQNAGFRELLAACFELPAVHPLADPYSALTLNVVAPGDDHPWHFDTNEIAVSLLTRAPDEGGSFEYCPGIRTPDGENLAGVRAVLDGDRGPVRSLDLRPGDLQLFRGRYSLHRVTPVAGPTARHTAIFAYSDRPGVVGSPTRTRQLFGRVDPAHLAAASVRSDTLLD
ncbi:arpA protein [Actinomycetospora endophytica]|uniref:ArpA protein n=1 Tax=Actinomycetospora endophytica TaxID=2291215 RepID=A0ABS8P9Z8_9PSEU|nr:arpA protein [Actinomycetospora endophytica]MCD2195048.1 arpA protein [Actinomycetospora endophytica]